MPSVISGDANVSATEFGFLDGVTSSLQSQIDSKLPLAGGKILQIVRATDSTDRTTTSTTFVDVTGMSVTITPQKSDSILMIVASFGGLCYRSTAGSTRVDFAITDSSNNFLSGAEGHRLQGEMVVAAVSPVLAIGYSAPATTSAVTYKLRFLVGGGVTGIVRNASNTGQMYAIEVSA